MNTDDTRKRHCFIVFYTTPAGTASQTRVYANNTTGAIKSFQDEFGDRAVLREVFKRVAITKAVVTHRIEHVG